MVFSKYLVLKMSFVERVFKILILHRYKGIEVKQNRTSVNCKLLLIPTITICCKCLHFSVHMNVVPTSETKLSYYV